MSEIEHYMSNFEIENTGKLRVKNMLRCQKY